MTPSSSPFARGVCLLKTLKPDPFALFPTGGAHHRAQHVSAKEANRIPDAFDQLTIRSATILTPRRFEVFDLMLDCQQYSLARWRLYNPEEAKTR
jgi:hypothetical protein